MTDTPTDPAAGRRPLRLWPGVVIAAVQLLFFYSLSRVSPDAYLYAVLGWVFGGVAVFLWWTLFSRAPWLERVGALLLVVAAMAVTPRFLHESIAEGNMGMQFFGNAMPILGLTFVAWAVATRSLTTRARWASMVATILLTCGAFTLLRSKGVRGDGAAEFAWRWSETAEERLLAQAASEPLPIRPSPTVASPIPAEEPAAHTEADSGVADAAHAETAPENAVAPAPAAEPASVRPDWPGFRGPHRDGVIPGVRIGTDWSSSPPVELWHRAVGPGVSSFAVEGDLLYTQEQRGDEELVVCYRVASGEPVWRHSDEVRFWDAHVGAGPRATPALGDDRVYALGATGTLNALDAADGSVVWSRDAAADTGAELPTWGFVSSPLVVDDLVIVHVGALVAYDAANGELRWTGPAGGSYSSPQLLTLDGVRQVVLLSHAGTIGVAPSDGALLWEDSWGGIGIVQPVQLGEGDVLISMVDGGAMPMGTRRIAISRGGDGWSTRELWTSNRLKTSFSPLVAHEGYAYGFDGNILACIDVRDGERRWKGGRYGSGQLVLLPDQGLLLVVTEQGDLALVKAVPDGFEELARLPAIEGKTWSQPAVVRDVLLVRNGEEMAAFRLPAPGA